MCVVWLGEGRSQEGWEGSVAKSWPRFHSRSVNNAAAHLADLGGGAAAVTGAVAARQSQVTGRNAHWSRLCATTAT